MITLVTGGSGSGKSAYAESLVVASEIDRRIYIATMHPYDEESYRRIERHRDMRAGKGFETIEQYFALGEVQVPTGCCVLLECMSNLVANEVFMEEGAGQDTVESVLSGIRSLVDQCAHLIVVTNEIFSDGILYDSETRRYQQYLGEINQQIGRMADAVVEVVYGIPVERKRSHEQIMEQL